MGLAVGLLVVYTLLFSTGISRPARIGGDRDGDLMSRLRGSITARVAQDEPEGSPARAKTDPGNPAQQEETAYSRPVVPVWGADPFVRDWVMTAELAGLNLRAITIGGERSYVLINDQILEEGDVIAGKRIVSIASDNVILEQGGFKFTLTIGE